MNKENRNIEDFLRGKMSQLESSFQDDWSVFEEKLERALFLKRLRIGIAFSVLLIATSIGILSTSNGLGFRTSDTGYFGRQSESGFEVSGSQSQWSTVSLNQPIENSIVEVVLNQRPEKQEMLVNSTDEKARTELKALSSEIAAVETAVILTSAVLSQVNGSSGGKGTNSKVEEQVSIENNFVNLAPKTALIKVEPLIVESSLENSATNQENGSISQIAALELNNLNQVFSKRVELKPYISPTPIQKARPSAYISPLQEKSLWEFSIKAYPNFTFRKFKVDEDKLNLLHRDFIDQVEVAESGGFTFNVGLEVSRRVADATYINSGIEYISYKTDANFDFTNFRTAIIDKNTQTISSYRLNAEPEQIVISDVNSYHYINIPLSIAYRPWASKHIRLNIETGISYMRFLTAKGNSIDYRTLEVIDLADRDYRKSMGSVSFRVGGTYYISSQFNLGFEPTFVYFTNTIYTEEYPFEIIPYSVGLNLKLQVKLN